jgi:hypothetical protein
MDRSRLRQRAHRARQQIDRQLDKLLERGPFIKGAVYALRRNCGKSGCRCQKGALHESLVLAVPEQGRKRIRLIPKGQEQRWRVLAGRYRRFRRSRAELVKLFARVLALVDEVEAQRTIPPPEA